MQKVNLDDGGLPYATKLIRNLDFFRNVGLKSEFLLLEREGKNCLCHNVIIKINSSTSTIHRKYFYNRNRANSHWQCFVNRRKLEINNSSAEKNRTSEYS